MKAHPDVSYADVLWAACTHIAKHIRPNHPELAAQITFDNDAVATIFHIIQDMHGDLSSGEHTPKFGPQVGHA